MRGLEAKYPALSRNAPALLMALAALASVVALLVMQSGLTFFQDEWNMVIHRQGFNADAFFAPNDVHPVPLPVAIYKLCLEIFGLTTVGPDRVIAVVLYATTAVLLFLYVRKRLGGWLALFPAVILLFLGPGWNVLLWPFEMTLVGSLAAGLATLLALERDDRRGDGLACLLLVVSMSCSSLGISFALAAGVDVLLKHRRRGLWRLYVPALALVLYVIWYLAYGHKTPTALSFTNVVSAPLYVAEGVSSSLSSLVGLNAATPSAETFAHPDWGPPLLVAVVVLTVLWLRAKPRQVSAQILVVATAALSFWILGGFNFIPGREPTASRYQYIGVVFIVLIAAEAFRGVRLGGRALAIVAGLAAIALVSNLVPLKDGLVTVEQQSELARGELAAIEIARQSVDPEFALTPEIAATATLTPIDAGSYLEAVDEHGSPAAPLSELPSLGPGVRKQIDVVLVNALPVELLLHAGPAGRNSAPAPQIAETPGVQVRGNCLELAAGAAGEGLPMTLTGSISVQVDRGPAPELGIWRYGEEPALENQLETGSTSELRIPADRSDLPWHALLTGEQAISVCTTGGDLGSSG
ncbi:MAG: hypothetical protein ACOYD4_13820 [Solirubrobacterales bacterium]